MKETEVNKVAILCLIILICAAVASTVLFLFKPKAAEEEKPKVIPAVEVVIVKKQEVEFKVTSQGVLEPRTETLAASEVAGRVLRVADNFGRGASFREGDVLLEIDPSDYTANLAQAEAALADAGLAIEIERAKAKQAERDWKKLGGGTPTDLVLRKPQLAGAEAGVVAAEASVAKARRDLERTKLRAPYDGMIRSTSTDMGSYVTVGSPLAEMYSTGVLEVRLPLPLDDYRFVSEKAPVGLVLSAPGNGGTRLAAEVVRVEGEIDRETRSIYLIGALEVGEDSPFLPGLFVGAEIEGRTLGGVVRLPRRVMVEEGQLLVIDSENRLRFRTVEVVRKEATEVLVSAGVEEGDRVCVTALAAPVEGMEVQVVGVLGGGDEGGLAGPRE